MENTVIFGVGGQMDSYTDATACNGSSTYCSYSWYRAHYDSVGNFRQLARTQSDIRNGGLLVALYFKVKLHCKKYIFLSFKYVLLR